MNEQTTGNFTALQGMTLEQLLAKAKDENHPWLPAIGIFQNDQIFEEWQQAIRDYRRSVDEYPAS